jgi:alpha-1,6-mannosyltransferase
MHRRSLIQLSAFTLLSLLGYVWLGYGTVRTDFGQLVLLFGLLCAVYLLALYRKVFNGGFPLILGIAMLLRISLLFMTPNLSDDYFRFIWDGLLFAHGYNPYLIIPSQFIHGVNTVPGITDSLYAGLNSPNYYTVYPPACEFIFGFAAKVAGVNILGNIIIIRLIILLAEAGTIFLLHQLVPKLRTSTRVIAIYAFNPLAIIELTGNLHLEAVMLLFLVLSIYLLVVKKQIYSAVSFGLAVGVKLLPFIFLPLLVKRLGITKSITFYAIVAVMLAVLFLPFYSIHLIPNFFSSLRLYFQTFEFNASLYYLFRWVGYQLTGYNVIATLGVVMAVFALLIIITVAVTESTVTWLLLFQSMLFCLTAYFLFTTTVHPWYITPLVLISIFTNYRYPILWSVLIILSYSAYRTVPYSENLWLVALEYMTVLNYMGYELFRNRSSPYYSRPPAR